MKEYIIKKPHQLEVDIKRIPLSFQISVPENMSKKTIPIVVLHGYGECANSDYMKSVHRSLSSNYDVAIITVNYIGTFIKTIFMDEGTKPYDFLKCDLEIIEGESKNTFLRVLKALSNNNESIMKILIENKIVSHDDFQPNIKAINLLINKITNKECTGMYVLERLYEMGFTKAIINLMRTSEGDHQDFGLIQAIDVMTAISHIKNEDAYRDINWSKLSIVGTSHGGYIASMCDKIAPNTFNMIINNSGWLYVRKNEILPGYTELKLLNVSFNSFENNYWSAFDGDRNYFSSRHEEIRSLINIKHIYEQKEQTKNLNSKKYVFIHTSDDHLIPLEEKDAYIEDANNIGSLEYIRIDKKSKLDGRTFKSLRHGGDASLKGLVIDYVVKYEFNSQIEKNDFDLKSIIEYKCTNGTYSINYTNKYPKIEFNIF
jgi:hypothetical protein